jgi:NAD(P)-dependent dehydrogenase (short-subunit alcohol dehydrogenase family)
MDDKENKSTPHTGFASYPSLHDRTVLITGGASGIGEKLVEAFVQQGARVAFLDIQAEAAKTVIQNAQAQGKTPPTFLHCDLTDINCIRESVEEIARDFGAIDVLVNNAGNDTRHSIEEVTPESWDRIIALNLKHQFFLVQAVSPHMKKAGRGSIVNLSSISWMVPSVGLPVYIAAKAGIVGLTRTLAHELGHWNIRVNAVLPGAIETERQKRLWYTEEYKKNILHRQALKITVLPEDVARLILFLAADDSRAITNQSYVIDAGWV